MPTLLDVLFVCSGNLIAEPWSKQLRRVGFEPTSHRVGSAEEFHTALGRPWRLILADVAGPFGACQALQALAGLQRDLPLIALGGRGDEETFVDLLQAGARDVLPADQLNRLGPVVRRELLASADRRELRQARLALRSVPAARAQNQASLRRETKLHRGHGALLELARSRIFQGENLGDDLRQISEVAARALDVGRVGIWLCDPSRTRLHCRDLFEPETSRHSGGMELLLADHPASLLALEPQRLLVVHDARRDSRTQVSARGYLEPHGITSMLAAAVRRRGELVGVICLEHVGPPRRWTTEEEIFASALADLVSLALETADRKEAEAALRDSELRFREIFENTRDAIVLIGVRSGGRFVCEAINPTAEVVSGLRSADLEGKAPREFLPAAVVEQLTKHYRECLRAEAPLSFEHELHLPSGPRWFSTLLVPIRHPDGAIYRLAAIARDITDHVRAERDREQLQGQLHQARKLEALGTLAGGVAHDFNNFLTGILGNAELLQQSVGGVPEARERLAQILEISLRARDLVRQILTFSRNGLQARRPLQLGPIVRAAMKYLRVAIPPGIKVEMDLPEREPQAMVDPTQMHQVVANLCTNAIQAMSDGGGTLGISLADVRVDATFARQHAPLREGRYVRLTVHDTGCGMTGDTLERLFEPFFTTRPFGQGTGLGLAIVHGVVSHHDGAIVVSSQQGQGATFQVYLPALEQTPAEAPPGSVAVVLGNGQRILFVDDQPFMADYGQTLLRRLGYRPEVFTDPERALLAFRADPGGYSVVITDHSMPQMTGFDLAQRIRAVRADVPILLLTGFEGVLEPTRAALAGVREIVPKPFTLEALADLIQRVLPKG
jgi:PAS domain S-box-containing protein